MSSGGFRTAKAKANVDVDADADANADTGQGQINSLAKSEMLADRVLVGWIGIGIELASTLLRLKLFL